MGYGEFVFSEQKGGLACCWSIKNPEVTDLVNQSFFLVNRDFINILCSWATSFHKLAKRFELVILFFLLFGILILGISRTFFSSWSERFPV